MEVYWSQGYRSVFTFCQWRALSVFWKHSTSGQNRNGKDIFTKKLAVMENQAPGLNSRPGFEPTHVIRVVSTRGLLKDLADWATAPWLKQRLIKKPYPAFGINVSQQVIVISVIQYLNFPPRVMTRENVCSQQINSFKFFYLWKNLETEDWKFASNQHCLRHFVDCLAIGLEWAQSFQLRGYSGHRYQARACSVNLTK